jgi:RNA polymerase sigma factor (sigma-70 family)
MADVPPTRASLLLRLRDPRDGTAWREFVELYAPLVYGYLRKQGLQDADAADVSQDVLVAVAGAIGRLEYEPRCGAFRNWLFTVVRHKVANWWRARVARTAGSGDTGIHDLLAEVPAKAGEANWQAEWEQRSFAWACEQIRKEVAERTWQAFWRTAVDGQAGKSVAAELGMTVAAVYLARRRVLARLKELIQSVQEA